MKLQTEPATLSGRARHLTPIELRLKAERQLGRFASEADEGDSDMLRVLHELHVHDAELAIQNEELRDAREELEDALSRYRDLFDLAPIGYLYIDVQGRVEAINWAACAMFASTPEELLGKELSVLVIPEDAQAVHRHLQYVRTTRSRHQCDVRRVVAAGEHLALRIFSIAPAKGDHSICTAVLDVTDFKRIEEMGREQKARAQSMSDASPDAIITVDSVGTIISTNAAVERVFGHDLSDLLGSNVAALIPSWSAGQSQFGGGPGSLRDDVGCQKDGTLFPISIGATVFGDGSLRVTLVVRDRREDVRVAAAFRQAEKMDAVGKLTAGIAHDINNVLSGIACFAESALRQQDDSAQGRADLLEIKQAVGTGMSVVRQLVNLISPQGVTVEDVPVDATIRRLEPMLVRLLGEQVQLRINYSRSGATIRAIPGDLEQILINLTLNARDAMQGVGTLQIETTKRSRPDVADAMYVVVNVEDTGTGMNEETQKRLFQPFFTTKGELGTGLGLMTMSATVKRLGGWIEVDSQPGYGTRFTIYFPQTHASVREMMPALQAGTPHERRLSGVVARANESKTILVVDDDAPTRAVLQRLLQDTQYRVLTAAGVSEALHIVESESIDVLLTDLIVGDGRGDTLADMLRERISDLAVLFVSGWPMADDERTRRSLSRARTRFVSKPVEFEAIVAALAELFERAPDAVPDQR